MNSKILILATAAFTLLASQSALAKHDDHDKKGKALPPGLQKKLARGEPLPPGWQKKYHRGDTLEQDLYDRGQVRVPVGQDGSITLDIEGTWFRLHADTREILEILGHH
ncbi:hypothetical protein [Shewanella salipaludis]|uniref:Nickel/cobalt transporter regulator n=1 Tax=Shewanella salipaludis TaxID=2723052 RepID=A0A972JJ49_9GAMM|nr:hypothetical protein [Shewanella salipaludis]NMH63654.1 hypothetical protein [Shewanella salipaludis]